MVLLFLCTAKAIAEAKQICRKHHQYMVAYDDLNGGEVCMVNIPL